MSNQILQFDDSLHEQLYCCFIAEASSATYKMYECFNACEEMEHLISTIINEYELMYLDRSRCEES